MSAKIYYLECRNSEESDRSSVSSIPWNSDAIKQNKTTWERIERMLQHEEALPEEEPELRQEILDWQNKFPQLAKTNGINDWAMKQDSFNTSSTNISEIADFSSSLDDDFIEDDKNFEADFLETPKAESPRFIASSKIVEDARYELADVFSKDLHITPLTLRQRRSARLLEQRKSSTTSTISDSPVPAKTVKYKNLPTNTHNNWPSTGNNTIVQSVKISSRFHVPPILNVLETKRRFCTMTNNRSFVQLTQIQQAKSAVHTTARQPPLEKYRVWNKPLAAVSVNSQFLNNRNAINKIILPALGPHHSSLTKHGNAVAKNQKITNFSNSNSSLNSGDVRGRQRMHHFLTNSQTTTSTTSGGRSISAVPMHMHGAFYHL